MVTLNVNNLLIPFVALSQVNAVLEINNNIEDHIALAEFTGLLVRKYSSKASPTIVVREISSTPFGKQLNAEFLDHVLFNIHDVVGVELYFSQTVRQPWQFYIIVIDDVQSFIDAQWNFPVTCYDNKYHFLIVLTNFNTIIDLKNLFNLCYKLHLQDVNVVLYHPSHGVSMYTYDLFTKDTCQIVTPVLYFRLRDGLEQLKQIFPQKLSNLHGCPIRVCARLNPPMTMLSKGPQNDNSVWGPLRGIDVQLIDSLAHGLNFSVKLINKNIHTINVGSLTAPECLDRLVNDTTDIAIGGFSASNPGRCGFSVSDIYHHSPVVFALRGGRKLSSLSRLARPFHIEIWQNMAIFLLSSTLGTFILRRVRPSIRAFFLGDNNRDPIMNFFATLLGYSIAQLPRRNFARYCLMLWLLTTLVLRNAYQGSLYDSIRLDKFRKIPSGYKDMHAWNYKMLISEYIESLHMFQKNECIITQGEPDYRLRLVDESTDDRLATVLLEEHFIEYMRQNYRKGSQLKMVNERVYMIFNSMFFAKHSIFMDVINRKLERFMWTGVTKYIVRRSSKQYTAPKHGAPNKPITFDRLRGLYEIYVSMMGLALGVFIFERLSAYSPKLRIILEWLN